MQKRGFRELLLPQTRLNCNPNKASLHCKLALFALQRSLVCMPKKPCLMYGGIMPDLLYTRKCLSLNELPLILQFCRKSARSPARAFRWPLRQLGCAFFHANIVIVRRFFIYCCLPKTDCKIVKNLHFHRFLPHLLTPGLYRTFYRTAIIFK